ncbi:hypothetical protein Tco_1185621 [Tanacetum coccineum]
MVSHIISISLDSSEESVGSQALRVILFGTIPAIIPVIPELPIAPVDPDSLFVAPSSEFLLAPVVAPPGFHRWPTILVRPDEAIPFGRPYHIHPNGLHFTSDSFSSNSSSDSSSDISLGSSSDSLSDSEFIYQAYMHWRSAPLATLYPPTTSESSLDSSSERSLDSSSTFAGLSRKKCRSPTTLVPSSNPVSRLITPALADLPLHKRFKDSYS